MFKKDKSVNLEVGAAVCKKTSKIYFHADFMEKCVQCALIRPFALQKYPFLQNKGH